MAAAEQLAADIQRALAAGDHDVLTPEALQKLMTAACRLYSAQSEAGSQMLPVGEVTPDRHHDHGERPDAGRQSRRVRAWNVAELDGALNAGVAAQTDIVQETAQELKMDLQSDRGRRVSVEELNTSRLLAHAAQQAHQRKFDEMMIVDVDAHHYENEHIKDILPYMENDVLRQLSMAQTMKGGRGNLMPVQVGYQDMGGRVTRYPLRTHREDRPDRPAARRRARPALDGRHERRLFVPVPDRHAQHRPASAEGDGGRPVLGLQPLGHREGAAGIGRPLLHHAVAADLRSPDDGAAPRRDLRRPQGRRRLHGHDRAQHPGARQLADEGLPRDRGARPRAVVPLGVQLERERVQDLQPLPRGARARLLVLQHPASHQLGHQRRSPSASPSCR